MANKPHAVSRRLLWLPVLLFGGLGVAIAFIDPSFGVDEAYTMDFIKGGWGRLLTLCAADVHPPLYYMLLKVWVDGLTLLGVSATAAAKMFSTLPLILLMAMGPTLIARRWGVQVALPFELAFLAGNMMHYTSVLRMYSFACLFVTLCAIAAFCILEDGGRLAWVGFTLSGLAAAYTHYFACVSVVCLYGFLCVSLWRRGQGKRIAGVVGCAAFCVLGYLPWLPSMLGHVSAVKDDYWIESVGPKTFALCLGTPFASERTPVALLCGAVFALTCAFVWGNMLLCLLRKKPGQGPEPGEGERFCGALFTAPATVAVGALVSWLIRPVFVARYMVPCVGTLWLALGLGARRLSPKQQRRLWCVLALCAVINCGKVMVTESTQGAEYRRFMDFHETAIGDSLIVNDEYHLRETLYFTHPQWNQTEPQQIQHWDGKDTLWVISAEDSLARRLAKPGGGQVTDWGPFQMCEDHFHIYSIMPPQ